MTLAIVLISCAGVLLLVLGGLTAMSFGGGSLIFLLPLVGSIAMARLLIALIREVTANPAGAMQLPRYTYATLAYGAVLPICWLVWLYSRP